MKQECNPNESIVNESELMSYWLQVPKQIKIIRAEFKWRSKQEGTEMTICC